MRFLHPLTVRYADTDAQGRVFFANYLTFFDEAATGYLHAIGISPSRLAELGLDLAYVDARCSYRGSARFEDRLQIGCRFESIGETSIEALFEVFNGPERTPIATGRCVVVMVDAVNFEKRRVPDALRQAVERFEGGEA